jgi:hypothetical protein
LLHHRSKIKKMKTLNTQKTRSMKNIYILLVFSGLLVTALFGFDNHRSLVASQVNVPFSMNTDMNPPVANPAGTMKPAPAVFENNTLAPLTPAEADFSDAPPENPFMDLNPVTPQEASFEDVPANAQDLNVNGLSPVTPSEADFDETTIEQPASSDLNPVTPSEADFEELI